MTVTPVSSWVGGAVGVTVTTTTEPAFSAANGTTRVYGAAIGGDSGGSLRVTGSGDMSLALAGRTHLRMGYHVQQVSGTQTATAYVSDFRTGATLRGNAVLHNTTNKGRVSLRSNTTIGGTTTPSMVNGTTWWLEVEYLQGTGYYFHFWYTLPATGAPSETFFIAETNAADTFRIGNSGATTGLVLAYGALWTSDGEQIAPGAVPPAGTLTFLSNVWASQTEAVFVGKVAGATDVEVQVGSETETVAPDADGYFRAVVTGLSAGTGYAWDVLVDGVSRRTGNVTTLASTADGLTFLWGSCFDTYTSGFFTYADARNPDFIVGLGDHGYQYITGGPNGNTSPTDVATCRLHREPVLTAAAPQALFTKYPYSQTFSDCDGGGANSDSTTGGLATGAVQAAHRQQFAHPTLPLTNSAARSWVVGRVRFIQTDETAAASAKATTDDSSKTKLGTEQKTWFKAQIDAAVSAGQAVIWFGDGPWIEPTSLTGNSWRAYNTERTELGNYIQASGVKLVRLHGDTHTLFYDNGTNNPWGGFPTASAAPWHTTAQPFGFTVSGGNYPGSTTNSSRQYGVGGITDDGSAITLSIQGYSSTNAAPTEVERFNASIDLTPSALPTQPWDAVYVGGALADAVYVGTELVWAA